MEMDKASWRAAHLTALRSITAEDRVAWSADIRRWLTDSEIWKQAGSVMLFAALKYEPDLLSLLAMASGPRISFPAMENDRIIPRLVQSADELIVATHGIREPSPQRCPEVPAGELDLVLVPGLGFASNGTRLGRGRGHYDRFLAGLRGKTVLCGVCFACQLQPALPFESHDVRMSHILTEHGFSSLDRGHERDMDAAP